MTKELKNPNNVKVGDIIAIVDDGGDNLINYGVCIGIVPPWSGYEDHITFMYHPYDNRVLDTETEWEVYSDECFPALEYAKARLEEAYSLFDFIQQEELKKEKKSE